MEQQVTIVIGILRLAIVVRVFIDGRALDIVMDIGTAAPLEQQDDPSPSDLK